MLNRYVRITPQMKTTEPVDIEVSGFKLFSGDNQVDISAAEIRINFIPVSGNAAMVKRDTIVIGEALVIPANRTRGSGAIYIDLIENKNFDAFQIGFGSSQAKSLTKLKVEYSNDGITYRRVADITMNVRLKYRNPWTFSGLSDRATTGFPALLQRSLHHQFINYGNVLTDRTNPSKNQNVFISNDGRSIFSKQGEQDVFNGNVDYGSQVMTTVSSHLRRGKYYFEVSSKSGVNLPGRGAGFYMGVHLETKDSGQTGGSWGDWSVAPPAGRAWPSQAAVFSLSTRFSGIRPSNNNYLIDQTLIGGPVPPGFTDVPGGKKGFLAGFTVDTVTGVVKVVNSPFTPEFQFNGNTFIRNFTDNPDDVDKRCYFSIFAPDRHDSTNMDLTFNFGQDPFIGSVPSGFDDRIGARWEMELDPNEKTITSVYKQEDIVKGHLFYARIPYTEDDYTNKGSFRDDVIDPSLTYYVKGKITDVDGQFPRRTVEIYTFPQMQHIGSCVSSTIDGTYEFLNLWYRDYIVISNDNINNKFESTILGPLKPVLMDPTL